MILSHELSKSIYTANIGVENYENYEGQESEGDNVSL